MRRFVGRLLLYILPFAMLIVGTLGAGYAVGESVPLPLLVQMQQQKLIDGPTLPTWEFQEIYEYKLISVIQRQPEVMVLGSSRMYFFRGAFLNKRPDAFFNAALSAASIFELRTFVERLSDEGAMPKILIIGLDYMDYNLFDEVRTYNRITPRPLNTETTIHRMMRRTTKLIRRAMVYPHTLIDPLSERPGEGWYGLRALSTGRGYLNDGSFYIPENSPVFERNLPLHMQQLQDGEAMYQFGNHVDSERLDTLEDILKLAAENDTFVIGFLPPFRSQFYDALMNSGQYGYIPELHDRLDALFGQYDFPILNMSDVTSVGGNDEELYDSYHLGELLSLRVYVAMLEEFPEVLGAYSDIDALRADIAAAEHPIYVYSPPIFRPDLDISSAR